MRRILALGLLCTLILAGCAAKEENLSGGRWITSSGSGPMSDGFWNKRRSPGRERRVMREGGLLCGSWY